MHKGKVWLVGAGPGDAGLFTLKGLQVLEQAEVVFYDSLVGQGILAKIPETAKLINVGKRASHHTMPQSRINELLLEEALKGKRVVRLKGGDPFLFGRGGEELELLEEFHVPYEVVPGVTSSIAVPAYNGIPVTHRDFCSSLHIITGHKKAGEKYDIDFEALVHTKGTLVFLMGVSALSDICSNLIKAGMPEDMPAAILQKGTTAGQKRIVASLVTLEEEVKKQGIETPAIIVVGKVCALADAFAWYEKLPLAGYKVLLTRPKNLISKTAAMLREKGAEVLELPAIRTETIENNTSLKECLEAIKKYAWIVFTSPTGVRVFFEQMKEHQMDHRYLADSRFAVIGTGTAKELEKNGFFPDLMPEIYDGETLGKELAEICKEGEEVLIPRAEIGNQELVTLIQTAGAKVTDVPTYRTSYEKSQLIDEKAEFECGNIDCVVFTSASTVKGFVEGTEGLDYSKVKAACIGKQTKAAADAFGMQTEMAQKATMESLVQLVVEMKEREEESWS